jgi:NitT/TauT family transport system substrate-binding protein
LPVAAIVIVGGDLLAWAGDRATSVTLQLQWTHQASFAGHYVADKQGLYAREGLSVQFVEGGPNTDLITPVVSGRAQFGIASAADLLYARASGQPVRAIAAIFRHSPIVYISKGEAGITRPVDFIGKTIRLTTVNAVAFYAMMSRAGIGPDRYRLVVLPSDVALFASGAADVWSVYVNNFAVTLERAGYRLNYIYPDDYGVHFYGDVVFTTDDVIATQPDLVLRFLRATLDGWEIAVEDPALVGVLVRAYDPRADVANATLEMRATQVLVNTGEDHIGWMHLERWAQMAKILQEQNLLSGPVDLDSVFTSAFLQKIYGVEPAPR